MKMAETAGMGARSAVFRSAQAEAALNGQLEHEIEKM
jgi:hypothetical protein